eukprot:CAMPEP_0174865974 /NCGR_PEP_ID=MMETSP1114-20130205/61301_1 /TAXON_ID=312471 /ORGANISM="Neobodo designis, Strain CCAP 1951/1" /LENGTH=69 /DNA_ID=CAMNT_0016101115 /DNA_START=19 /DNA_END=224 /DNA_ORIENTATION=+
MNQTTCGLYDFRCQWGEGTCSPVCSAVQTQGECTGNCAWEYGTDTCFLQCQYRPVSTCGVTDYYCHVVG